MTGINCLLFAAWFLILRWRSQNLVVGTLSWATGMALHGAGWVTIVLRSSDPQWAWLLPGAILMLPGTLFLLDGFYRLLNARPVPRVHWVLLINFELLLLYFTYANYHAPVRGIISSAYHAFVILWMVFVLPGNSQAVSKQLRLGLRAVLALVGLALALRTIANILYLNDPHYTSLTDTRIDLATTVLSFSTAFMPSFIFLAISNEVNERRRITAVNRLDDLVASVDGIVWEADARTVTFTYVSGKAERLLGYPASDWLQPGFWQSHIYKDDQTWAPQFCAERARSLEPHEFEYRFVARDGRVVWLRDLVSVVAEQGEPRWLRGVMVDITARKKSDEELKQLNFIYELLSHCRKSLSEAADPEILFEQIVKSCTISDDILLAWIGQQGADSRSLIVKASAGPAIAYLDDVKISADESLPEGRGPTGRAMREKRSIFVNHLDITSHDIFTPVRLKYGMHSCASVYFIHSNGQAMSLNLYAAPGNFFSAHMIASFEQLAHEISLTLDRFAIDRWRTFAEQQIREHQILLDFAIESTVDAVWDFNPKTNSVKFSHHWEAMLGYDKGELKHSLVDWEILVHPQDLHTMNENLQGYLRGEADAFDMTLRMRSKRGEYIWVKDRGVVVERDESGNASRLVGTLKNIDSEVRSRKEARRNAILLDEIFNAAPVGFMVIGRGRRLIRANQKIRELSGLETDNDLQEILPQMQFFHLDGTAYAAGEVPAVVALEDFEKSYNDSYGVRIGSGNKIFWVAVSSRYVPALDVTVRVTTDISELADSRRMLSEAAAKLEHDVQERTRELEEINKELEAFSYSLSHDLKAPLVRAESWLNILQQKLRGNLDQNAEDTFRYVRRELAAMTSMGDAMMQLARVSQTEIAISTVDLSQMAEQILGDLRIENPECKIEADIQPALVVSADAALARVLVRNLLENAVKYSRLRPVVQISFFQKDADGAPCYCIRDNGIGFDMQYADRLFAPFQRLHSEKDYPGNGIGLATAQRIVHRHGGTISAESAVDSGTTISFALRHQSSEVRVK